MKVSCDRQPSNDGMEFLAIQAHLKKGPNGTLAMHDLSACVTYEDHEDEVRFEGVTRSSWQTERISNTSRATLDWKRGSAHSPLLKLVPDEEIDLTALHKVPRDAVCRVQVGFIGQRLRSPVFAQWEMLDGIVPADERFLKSTRLGERDRPTEIVALGLNDRGRNP